ncbi:MarR family transcriptional regulator [Nesterenkonia sp. MY13]|uniref:MarR family transcriptional regulator n=1 Tax=Nesterenkonia sedimenti TaxID=1463632 RepID=A0A7X8TIA6_9MICC|nr:MarR family transcriptional regulator [Nesterenkonia sedimenti]
MRELPRGGAEFGDVTQAQLGRDTGIDRSDVTAVLVHLEERELVAREVDPSHRRRKIVSITTKGRRALINLDEVLDEIQEELLAPLTAVQREQLHRIMLRIAEG